MTARQIELDLPPDEAWLRLQAAMDRMGTVKEVDEAARSLRGRLRLGFNRVSLRASVEAGPSDGSAVLHISNRGFSVANNVALGRLIKAVKEREPETLESSSSTSELRNSSSTPELGGPSFTSGCENHAKAAWRQTGRSYRGFIEWRRSRKDRSTREKVKSGCLGIFIFWIPFMLPLLLYTIVLGFVLLCAVYATLVSIIWGVSAGIARIRARPSNGPPT